MFLTVLTHSLLRNTSTQFGHVVFYEECDRQFTLKDRVPVWAVDDVMVVSAIREGVNLLPFEYAPQFDAPLLLRSSNANPSSW